MRCAVYRGGALQGHGMVEYMQERSHNSLVSQQRQQHENGGHVS